MRHVRTLLLTAGLAVATCLGAAAQTGDNGKTIMVARAASAGASAFQPPPTTVNPLTYASLRGGVLVSPRGAGLVGLDVSVPGIATGSGWHMRVDGDVIFKANFAGIDTIVPITADLLMYSPGGAGGHGFYYGGGLGAVLGGKAVFDGKLVLGTDLSERLGAEVNVHFTDRDTLVTLVARIHL